MPFSKSLISTAGANPQNAYAFYNNSWNLTDVYYGVRVGWIQQTYDTLIGDPTSSGLIADLAASTDTARVYLDGNGNTPGVLEWWLDRGSGGGRFVFITSDHTEPGQWHDLDVHWEKGVGIFVQIDGDNYGNLLSTASNNVAGIYVGQKSAFAASTDLTYYWGAVTVGTTGYGSTDLFSDSFASSRRMLEAAPRTSSVSCARARSGPTMSRGVSDAGAGRITLGRLVAADGLHGGHEHLFHRVDGHALLTGFLARHRRLDRGRLGEGRHGSQRARHEQGGHESRGNPRGDLHGRTSK